MLNSKCIPPFLILLINFSQSISFVMDFYFLIGYRQCGLKEISIRVKYLLKGRPINLATDIVAVAINLLDWKDIKNYWSLRLLVLNNILQINHSFYYCKILLEMSSSQILC